MDEDDTDLPLLYQINRSDGIMSQDVRNMPKINQQRRHIFVPEIKLSTINLPDRINKALPNNVLVHT